MPCLSTSLRNSSKSALSPAMQLQAFCKINAFLLGFLPFFDFPSMPFRSSVFMAQDLVISSSCSNLAFILSRYRFSFRLCAFFPTSDRFGSNLFDTIFCGWRSRTTPSRDGRVFCFPGCWLRTGASSPQFKSAFWDLVVLCGSTCFACFMWGFSFQIVSKFFSCFVGKLSG